MDGDQIVTAIMFPILLVFGYYAIRTAKRFWNNEDVFERLSESVKEKEN